MTSRTATAPRVTGGRPATMTRSAVQQARTQGRPTTPEGGGELTADGWVNVDHHKRKHKQPGGATGLVAVASASSTSGRHRNGNTNLNGNGNGHSHSDDRPNGREMRRTQSAIDTLTTTTTSTTGDEREEPPVARPNARADALSAAVTMDKKARERSYYAHSNSNANANGMTSPPASLSLPGATWGSPPPLPPPPPGLGVGPQRGLHRSNSMSPDASAMGMQLDRGSSLQKLMSSWQLSDDGMDQSQSSVLPPPGPGGGGGGGGGGGNGRTNTRSSTKSTRTGDRHADMTLGGGGGGGGNMFQFPFSDFPPEATTTNSLRRTQSDVVPATMSLHHTTSQPSGNRQRSPSTRHPNTNANANGTNTNHANANNANTNGTNTNGSNTNSRKCGDKRDFFFRNLEFETRSLLQIDEVASFSVTDFDMARKISHAIIELFPDLKQYIEQQQQADAFFYQLSGQDPQLQPTRKYPLIVTDATACVGGNVLSFCDYFHFVYAIENDPTRVAMLENNLRVLQKTNVTCRCASYLEVMYEYHQDVIFFDPPWGGPEYKDQDKVDLYLDEQPLYEICEQLHGYAKVIVLKVPTNFDDEKFAYCVSGRVTVRKDFKKMHLVVLDFR